MIRKICYAIGKLKSTLNVAKWLSIIAVGIFLGNHPILCDNNDDFPFEIEGLERLNWFVGCRTCNSYICRNLRRILCFVMIAMCCRYPQIKLYKILTPGSHLEITTHSFIVFYVVYYFCCKGVNNQYLAPVFNCQP